MTKFLTHTESKASLTERRVERKLKRMGSYAGSAGNLVFADGRDGVRRSIRIAADGSISRGPNRKLATGYVCAPTPMQAVGTND